jgi:hypothetical protein
VLLLGLSTERIVVQRSASCTHAGGGLRSRDGGHVKSFGLGRGGGLDRREWSRGIGSLGRIVGVGLGRDSLGLSGRGWNRRGCTNWFGG